MIRDGATVSIDEVDALVKYRAEMDGKSCAAMNNNQVRELIEETIQFGYQVGIELDYPEDKTDILIELNIKPLTWTIQKGQTQAKNQGATQDKKH